MHVSSASGASRALVVLKTVHNPEPCLIGIDTDDGQVAALEAGAQIGEIFELEVSVGAVAGGDLFVIHAQRIAHLVEQSRDGIGADTDAECEEFLGDSGRGAARPAQAGHGIAGRIVLQQAV